MALLETQNFFWYNFGFVLIEALVCSFDQPEKKRFKVKKLKTHLYEYTFS